MVTVAWVQMMLGRYPFSVATAAYQGFTRRAAWRWAKQERIGRAPAMQLVGPDAPEVEIEGVILPGYEYSLAGEAQLPAMRAEAGRGEPLILVDGLGFVWGRWCVLSVEERRGVFMFDGSARRIDFALRLTAYGEDAA
jgi:phage protein U